ncbi:hypothetical protein RMCBS344292_14659 [Rhizopus microsporus]|nr:hypothetical protein RMCBS344292_14659 [Rhizopus microsporus]
MTKPISSPVQQDLYIGQRVAVDSMGIVGTLKFLGEAEFKEGYWAGIQLDILGSGKNDGSVKGVRYFSCPPQTGLFVLASKVTPLDQDSDSVRSLSPPSTKSRTVRQIGLTTTQLQHQQQKPMNARPPSLHTPVTSPISSNRQSIRSLPQVQSPTPSHYRGIPSPAVTPTNQSSLQDDYYNDAIFSPPNEEMIADTPIPATVASTSESQEQLDHLFGESIRQAPNEAVMKLHQLQLRVEVLEAENRLLKPDGSQPKTDVDKSEAEHKAMVQDLLEEHEKKQKNWEQKQQELQQAIQRLETKIMELETEQMNLMTERDKTVFEATAVRKEKSILEHKVQELESKIAEAEAATAAAQASERTLLEKTKALQQQMNTTNHYFQPGVDQNDSAERQMKLEMEMEEAHEKMNSLREAARAKDMFLGQLSEQVEHYRNAVEEKEREIRRIKADADRHVREKDRVLEELKELEAKWLAHQDCTSKESFDKLKKDYNALKENYQKETHLVQEYQERVRGLNETIDELKRAGLESIELYESSVEMNRVDREALNASLADERRKVALLEAERAELHNAGREAIQTYEATIAEIKKERESLIQEQNAKREALEATIQSLKQEIEQLMNNAATEDLKDVWEKERKRLTEQVMISTEALEKEKSAHDQLRQEAEAWKEQLKESEKLAKERARLEEQLTRLQADYDEQLAARSKYLDEVRSAVESQKKAEAELRRMTEQKEKLERDLQEKTLAGATTADSEKYQLQVQALESEIENLSTQNTMLQKRMEETDQKDLVQLVESLKIENKRLVEKHSKLEESHKQVETECLKLMEEVEKLHHAEQQQPAVIKLEGLSDDDKVKELSQLLQENQNKIDQLVRNHASELRALKEKEEEKENEHKRQIASLNRDISELESLIESKVFKEADLEEALDKERKTIKKLQMELQDLKEDLAMRSRYTTVEEKKTTRQEFGKKTELYCEICEIPGHDLLSCKAVTVEDDQPERPYCAICEEYGLHSTDKCQSQSEAF